MIPVLFRFCRKDSAPLIVFPTKSTNKEDNNDILVVRFPSSKDILTKTPSIESIPRRYISTKTRPLRSTLTSSLSRPDIKLQEYGDLLKVLPEVQRLLRLSTHSCVVVANITTSMDAKREYLSCSKEKLVKVPRVKRKANMVPFTVLPCNI